MKSQLEEMLERHNREFLPSSPPSDDPEMDFVVKLEVHLKGHGRMKHRAKLAERMKRVLTTDLHSDTKVFIVVEEGTCNGRELVEVTRTDRNASAAVDAGPTDSDVPISDRR